MKGLILVSNQSSFNRMNRLEVIVCTDLVVGFADRMGDNCVFMHQPRSSWQVFAKVHWTFFCSACSTQQVRWSTRLIRCDAYSKTMSYVEWNPQKPRRNCAEGAPCQVDQWPHRVANWIAPESCPSRPSSLGKESGFFFQRPDFSFSKNEKKISCGGFVEATFFKLSQDTLERTLRKLAGTTTSDSAETMVPNRGKRGELWQKADGLMPNSLDQKNKTLSLICLKF